MKKNHSIDSRLNHRRPKLDRQNFCQQSKHAKLYSNPLQACKIFDTSAADTFIFASAVSHRGEPSAVRHPRYAIRHPWYAIHGTPSAIRVTPSTIRDKPSAVRHPPSAVSAVRHLPSAVRHPRYAISHPISHSRYAIRHPR